eukprot:364720-Chlamydomonas_euryale.AAC.3
MHLTKLWPPEHVSRHPMRLQQDSRGMAANQPALIRMCADELGTLHKSFAQHSTPYRYAYPGQLRSMTLPRSRGGFRIVQLRCELHHKRVHLMTACEKLQALWRPRHCQLSAWHPPRCRVVLSPGRC